MIKIALRMLIVVATLAAAVQPAAADKGGVPNANSANNNGQGPGSGVSPGPTQTPPGHPNTPPGQARKPTLPTTDADAAGVLTEVEANKALTLGELRGAVARVSKGRILDVTLARIGGRLVYDLTLEEGSVVRRLLVDARNGRPLRAQR